MKRLLLVIALSLPLLAQRGSDTVQVTLVEVPVTVVDRNGAPLRGLTAANFEVYDEGKKREITHFDAIELNTRTRVNETAAEQPSEETARPYMRNFMLLFDISDSTPGTLRRAREAALEFVDKQVQPIDRVAVGTVGVERGFQLLANFTLDREFVRALVSTLGEPKQFHANDPLLLARGDFDLQAKSMDVLAGVDANVGRAGEAVEHMRDLGREQKKAQREEQRHNIVRRIDNLAELGRVLDRISGRKQVILLSQGFDAKALQGREALSSQEAQQEQLATVRGQIWNVDSEARYGSSDALNTLQRMGETLKRSDVVLHALDIKGLRTELDESGERTTSTESLSLLTRDTGGTVYKNTNDLGAGFARLLQQQDVTYILGFQTSSAAAGKFHNLKVKLVNAPEGARVTHRQGYYEQSAATVDLDRLLSASEILTHAIPVDEVRVGAYSAAFPHREGIAQAPVVLEVDGNSLIGSTKEKTIPAEFYVYAFDRGGVVRDFVFQRVSFDLAKLRNKLEAKGVKFYHTLILPPGDYSIRALVRGEDGRSGFTSVPLHVASAGEATVAPALVDDTSGWVMVKAPDRGAAPVYPFVAGENVFVPAARPALKAGKHYEVALMTHNVPVEQLQVAAKIEGNGATKNAPLALLGRTSPDSTGGVKLMLQMTPPVLAPGPYKLVMTLRSSDQTPERTVSLPFEVQ